MRNRALTQIAAIFTLSLAVTGVSADSFDQLHSTGSAGALHEAAGAFLPVFDEDGTRTGEFVFLLHGGYPPELDALPVSDVWVLAGGIWQYVTSDAPAMASHALVECADGRAWAVGAVGRDGWTAAMDELFTFEVRRIHGALVVAIESVPIPGAAPRACFGATAVSADGGRSIFSIGGTCLGNPLDPDPGELWEYRIADNRWYRRADMPIPISDHSSVAARDFLWIFGGSTPEGLSDEVYRYDLLSDRWNLIAIDGVRPTPRRNHRAVAAGKTVLVFGGLDDGLPPNIETMDDVWQLDIDSLDWTEKTPMSSGLAGPTVAVVPRRISFSRMFEVLIYGGVVDAWSFPYVLSDNTSIYTSDILQTPSLAPAPSPSRADH
jgi:hypothetical protein